MSKQQILDFLKEKTEGKFDKDGNQVKVFVEEIIRNVPMNVKSLYASLHDPDFKSDKIKIKRLQYGKLSIFYLKRYWIEV